jgi:hypothetical protein
VPDAVSEPEIYADPDVLAVLPTPFDGSVRDPLLDGWGHFSFYVGTDFLRGRDFRGYDRATHRYYASYINPDVYRLSIDIRDGMQNGAPLGDGLGALGTASAASDPSRPPGSKRPGVELSMRRLSDLDRWRRRMLGDITDFVNGPLAPPEPPEPPEPVPPWVPEEVLGFEWIVSGANGFEDRKVRLRGDGHVLGVGFDLPSTGRYSISNRVFLKNGRFGQQTATFILREHFIVSLGDSSASGEGNPDSNGLIHSGGWRCEQATFSQITGLNPDMHIEAYWLEKLAHRSLTSGPAIACWFLQRLSGRTMVLGGGTAVLDKIVFASFARSGAGVIEGLLNTQAQPPNEDFIGVGQVEEASNAAAGRELDALLINIGGNDVGFSGVLSDLVAGDNVFTANDDNDPAAVEERIDSLLGQLEDNFDLLKSRVDSALRPRDVYITGYPINLFDVTRQDGSVGFRSCGLFQGWDLDIDPPDYDLIMRKGTALNDVIRRKANEFGWHLVEVADDFVGHGYCDDETLWVGAEESCRKQGDFEGTMHPNLYGHLLWADRFVEKLEIHTVVPLRGRDLIEPLFDPVTEARVDSLSL